VGAVLAGFLLALGLAASPGLHEFIHHDGGRAHHECLATTLQANGCDDALLVVMVVLPLAQPDADAPPREAELAKSFFLSCRVLEHAPPQSLLS
jgi:hypothetical protein